ncbi:hypothetical protein Hanom_Chr11g01050301 [Helianthus anomalus]
MPDEATLNVVLPEGKGDLGALGDPAAAGVPKQTVLKFSDRRRRKNKTHEAVSVPSLVSEVAGIPRIRLRKYEDYVVVSDTLEGLGVPGGSAAAGGSTVGTKLVDVKKRKGDAPVAGGEKAPKLRKTRATVEPVSFFVALPSPPKVVDVEVQKKGGESPSIEVVSGGGTPPSVHAEETSKKTAGETIVDTLDSSNKLIDPQEDDGNQGEKPKSPEKTSGSTAAGAWGEDQPSIQPRESELEFYYCSYAAERGFDYHCPTWNVLLGDDVSNDPSASREILRGVGTPFETARARGIPRQNRLYQLSSMLVGSSIIANAAEAEEMVKAAREGAEQLEKDKAAFEKLKQTERWATSVGLEQARAAKVLEDPDADCTKLNKVVEELKAEVQSRVTILEEVSARATEVEAWARQAEEVRDGLTTSLNQVIADRAWMHEHGIAHIVETILNAPENATAVEVMNERARQVGFKAGYNKCLGDVNPFFTSKFTEERSGFHGVDTEATYAAAVDAYNNLSISALHDIEKCLEAEDYVDRLCLMFDLPEEDEGAGGAKNDAGTSGTKAD